MTDVDDMAARVRRRDPDRYFCALFAPAAHRLALLTLAAFNDELARAREVASEPGLALIRLQWWREVVEGTPRRHEVADPLRGVIAAYRLPTAPLLDMIEAREADVEGPPPTLEEFLARMHQGPGALAVAAATILGADAPVAARIRALGAAYGVMGTLRNVAALAARGQCVLPVDMRDNAGPTLTAAARRLLGPPAPLTRRVVAAALPGVLARRDARRARPVEERGAGDRLAVAWAAVTGKV